MPKFFYRRELDEIEDKARPVHINSYRQLVWAKFKSHKLAMFGAVVLVGVILFTVFGPLFVDVGYEDMDFSYLFSPPLTEGHPFGTDELGHDVLVRVMYGGRISLFVGFASAVITTLIGTVVGLLSGFYGGLVDRLLMRFVDFDYSYPCLWFGNYEYHLGPDRFRLDGCFQVGQGTCSLDKGDRVCHVGQSYGGQKRKNHSKARFA
jgi:peptide/nickel transport system permease protein